MTHSSPANQLPQPAVPAKAAPGHLMSTRPGRLVIAFVVMALLMAARVPVRLVEGAYPLDHGIIGNAIEYILLAALLFLIGVIALVAWIAPGWTIARMFWPEEPPAARALKAVMIAFPIQALLLAAIVMLFGRDLPPEVVRRYLLAGQGLLLAGSALTRREMATATRWPHERVLLLAAFAFALTLILLPAIAWTDYNPDGVETLTLGRSVLSGLVPRLPNGGLPLTDLVMFAAAYPIAWLVAVGGPGETAARLPAIAYAVAIAAGVLALAGQAARRRLSTGECAVLLVGVAAVTLTLAINTAYHPYSTDIASPASIDLLSLVFLLATLYFVFEGSAAWVAASAALMSLTRPTGLLLFFLLAAAAFITGRNWRSPRFRLALVAVGVALVVSIAHGLARHDAEGTIARVRYLRFDDWSRLRFLLVPCGVMPVLAWAGWRRMDAWSREIALVAIAYFAFFYGMAFYALHHFAPAMLLPLVTFWRGEAQRESPARGRWRASATLGAIVAIAAALPRSFAPYRDARRVASGISYEIGDYAGSFAGIQRAFSGARALDLMFASPYIGDAQATRITESHSFIHYSAVSGRDQAPASYAVRDSSQPAPDGMTPVGTRNSATLYARDISQLEQERLHPPAPAPRSRWYDVPRTSLFRNIGVEAGIAQIDLLAVFRRVRGAIGGR